VAIVGGSWPGEGSGVEASDEQKRRRFRRSIRDVEPFAIGGHAGASTALDQLVATLDTCAATVAAAMQGRLFSFLASQLQKTQRLHLLRL